MYAASIPVNIDQSVIVKGVFAEEERDILGIALTPVCDIAHGKAEFVQFCGVFGAWELVRGLLSGDWAGLAATDTDGRPVKEKELVGRIRQIATQKFSRWHWLAPIPGTHEPLVVDFQWVASVPIEKLGGLEILGGLVSPYREQVAARYVAYMGRVGTPDTAEETLAKWAGEGIRVLFP